MIYLCLLKISDSYFHKLILFVFIRINYFKIHLFKSTKFGFIRILVVIFELIVHKMIINHFFGLIILGMHLIGIRQLCLGLLLTIPTHLPFDSMHRPIENIIIPNHSLFKFMGFLIQDFWPLFCNNFLIFQVFSNSLLILAHINLLVIFIILFVIVHKLIINHFFGLIVHGIYLIGFGMLC